MSDCNNIPFFEDDLHCYEDFKHNHEDHKPCDDHVKCCPDADCAPLKPNCKPECCEGLPPVIPDLSKAYAVPTLVNRIFDCIKLENANFMIKKAATFTVTSTPLPPSTAYTGKVCIDKVCVKYDAIGPVFQTSNGQLFPASNPVINVCSNSVAPQAVPGSAIPYPESKPYFISNNLVFNVNNTTCCYEHHHIKEGRQCKVVEQNIPFRILGFKVVVTGRIGCLPFTAEYVPTAGDGTDFQLSTLLGLPNNYNFFGKLCIPQSNSGVTIRENFESCLSIDCVDSPSELSKESETYSFTADVESSLLIKKTVFALSEEKLSVLAIPTPRKQYCHKPEHDSPCHPCSYDME